MSTRYPHVIASSVIRSTQVGESHGGVYIVDLGTGLSRQVIDWDDPTIDWRGRGGERGLRGMAIYGERIFIAAYDEIRVYDTSFVLIESYRNPYLRDIHEIFISGDVLFITSTNFGSILEFDLKTKSFTRGYLIRYGRLAVALRRARLRTLPALRIFDPAGNGGPSLDDNVHLNSVVLSDGALYVTGTGLGSLLCVRDGKLSSYATIPYVTHNAHPYRNGVLLNDTKRNRVAYYTRNGRCVQSFPVKRYRDDELLMSHLPGDYARQSFSRGMCTIDDGLVVGGSSPATISVYQLGGSSAPLRTFNVSMDVRNAIHGLEIWPF